ncbi:MAG: hypothetical protein Q9211_004150 [Gyalolechia sp. 1 TL-2023]
MPTIALRHGALTADGDAAAKVREWSSFIGIVTAIVGNILISFALNIQRYAHIRLGREKDGHHEADKEGDRNGYKSYGSQQQEIAEERSKANLASFGADGTSSGPNLGLAPTSKRHSFSSESSSQSTVKPLEREDTSRDTRTYLSSPYWWLGIILMVVGECGNFLAYGFAPASIVSPLGVVALVSNCIIAPWLLKERFRVRDLGGVMVAVAGAVVVVLSAKNSESRMGPHDIWSSITRWEFELYLGITAALIVVLIWTSGKYGEKSILIDLGLVGLFGGYTALSTKGVASLLSGTLWRTLTFPITYLLIVVLVGSAVMQIRYVNRALQRFDSTQVIPTQFVLFTISVIVGSAVLYRDFESATARRVGEFVGGCLLTFVGVYLITSGRSRGNDDEDHLADEEEAIVLVDEERSERSGSEAVARNGNRRKPSWSADGSPRSSRRSSLHNHTSLPHTPQRRQSKTSLSHSPSSEPHTPLTQNPWTDSREDYYTPPTRPTRNLESTISTPLLPSDAQRSNPHLPRRLSPAKPDRQSTLSRNSMAHLRPAPLMSPLSSSLSAIVADSLRRGVHDSPSAAAAARKRPRLDALRTCRSQRSPAEAEGVGDEGPEPSKGVQGADWEDRGELGRKQSVSAAFGEFLRLKFRREKDGDGGRVSDEGRSGDVANRGGGHGSHEGSSSER